MIRLIPKAVDNYEVLLNSSDEKIRLQASKDCLQNTGVMASHTLPPVMVNIMNQHANPDLTEELQQLSAYLMHKWKFDTTDVTPDEKN